MKITLFVSARDAQDGSFNIMFHNTKKEALSRLERTEKEIQEGTLYDDGAYKEVVLEFNEKGKLISNNFLDFE